MNIIKMYINRFILISTFFSLVACGDPDISAVVSQFDPKVVVQGYLYPNKDVNIIVTRNFPLEQNNEFNVFDLIIDDADVQLTDVAKNITYDLIYNPNSLSYNYSDNSLIDYNETYKLDVNVQINGQRLVTSSTTTVPSAGAEIINAESNLGPLTYRSQDEKGDLEFFEVAFKRSPNIGFYVIAIEALDASTATYIYDNPFNDYDENDVNFFFNDLKYSVDWEQNLPLDNTVEPIISSLEIQWINLQFYGRYRAILYAGDKNFKDFFLTHSLTQGMDGNFIEPLYHFEGDGIGVFGSAIVDTVYFEVSK